MGKCLITKLNGSSNNNTLPIIGKLRIKFDGVENNNNSSKSNLQISGTKNIVWKGEGTFNSFPNEGMYYYGMSTANKGIMYLDKYAVSLINTVYTVGANVLFDDLNKYCSNLKSLFVSNSAQEGNISDIQDIALSAFSCSYSKIQGDIEELKGSYSSLESFNISHSKVTSSLSSLKNFYNIKTINISNSNTYGDLSNLQPLLSLERLFSNDSGITGDLSSLASMPKLNTFENWNISNTWASDSLRDASYLIIGGIYKFSTATDTDNFLKNMAKCAVGDNKTIRIMKSDKTSDANSAISTLQSKGYTLVFE